MDTPQVDKQMNALIKLLEDCEKYIQSLIDAAVKQNPKQRSITYWKRRAQLVHNEIAIIRRGVLKRAPDLIQNTYVYGHDIARVSDGEIAPADLGFSKGINARAIALLSAGLNESLDMSLVTVGRQVDDAFRKAGLRAVAYHAAAGTDSRMAAKQMEGMLKRDSIRAFTDKAGRQWTLSNYTLMVILTTTREAMTQGTFSGLQQTGQEIYQVSHHINACKLCMEYDGKTFLMPGANRSQYTGAYTESPGGLIPPFHPRCKHILAPAKQSFDDIEAALLAKYGNAPAVAALNA